MDWKVERGDGEHVRVGVGERSGQGGHPAAALPAFSLFVLLSPTFKPVPVPMPSPLRALLSPAPLLFLPPHSSSLPSSLPPYVQVVTAIDCVTPSLPPCD